MDVEISWLDNESCVLKQEVFDPNSDEWAEFVARSVFEVIQMGGNDCTHFTMALS